MSLRLQGVRKSYPEFTIHLDLQARRGEMLTLLGPSGCGKTTSLRLVAGFLHPEAGRILIGGKSVEGEPPHRRRIGIVFQDYALFPNLNVLDNVCFGPAVQGWERGRSRARGRELLELVHLAGYERRRVNTLSGGERQRVALARALAPRPRLLLLDEPLSALDAKLRRSLRQEIQAVQRELAVTTVYVTHDQEEALAISDRIAVMRAGRIEQIGSPEEVYRRPASLFVAGFIGQANLIPGTVREARRASSATAAGNSRCNQRRLKSCFGLATGPDVFAGSRSVEEPARRRKPHRGARPAGAASRRPQAQAQVDAGGLRLTVASPEEQAHRESRFLRVDPEALRPSASGRRRLRYVRHRSRLRIAAHYIMAFHS